MRLDIPTCGEVSWQGAEPGDHGTTTATTLSRLDGDPLVAEQPAQSFSEANAGNRFSKMVQEMERKYATARPNPIKRVILVEPKKRKIKQPRHGAVLPVEAACNNDNQATANDGMLSRDDAIAAVPIGPSDTVPTADSSTVSQNPNDPKADVGGGGDDDDEASETGSNDSWYDMNDDFIDDSELLDEGLDPDEEDWEVNHNGSAGGSCGTLSGARGTLPGLATAPSGHALGPSVVSQSATAAAGPQVKASGFFISRGNVQSDKQIKEAAMRAADRETRIAEMQSRRSTQAAGSTHVASSSTLLKQTTLSSVPLPVKPSSEAPAGSALGRNDPVNDIHLRVNVARGDKTCCTSRVALSGLARMLGGDPLGCGEADADDAALMQLVAEAARRRGLRIPEIKQFVERHLHIKLALADSWKRFAHSLASKISAAQADSLAALGSALALDQNTAAVVVGERSLALVASATSGNATFGVARPKAAQAPPHAATAIQQQCPDSSITAAMTVAGTGLDPAAKTLLRPIVSPPSPTPGGASSAREGVGAGRAEVYSHSARALSPDAVPSPTAAAQHLLCPTAGDYTGAERSMGGSAAVVADGLSRAHPEASQDPVPSQKLWEEISPIVSPLTASDFVAASNDRIAAALETLQREVASDARYAELLASAPQAQAGEDGGAPTTLPPEAKVGKKKQVRLTNKIQSSLGAVVRWAQIEAFAHAATVDRACNLPSPGRPSASSTLSIGPDGTIAPSCWISDKLLLDVRMVLPFFDNKDLRTRLINLGKAAAGPEQAALIRRSINRDLLPAVEVAIKESLLPQIAAIETAKATAKRESKQRADDLVVQASTDPTRLVGEKIDVTRDGKRRAVKVVRFDADVGLHATQEVQGGKEEVMMRLVGESHDRWRRREEAPPNPKFIWAAELNVALRKLCIAEKMACEREHDFAKHGLPKDAAGRSADCIESYNDSNGGWAKERLDHPEFAATCHRVARAFHAVAGNAKWMKGTKVREQFVKLQAQEAESKIASTGEDVQLSAMPHTASPSPQPAPAGPNAPNRCTLEVDKPQQSEPQSLEDPGERWAVYAQAAGLPAPEPLSQVNTMD